MIYAELIQVVKEVVKRKVLDLGRRVGRLKTPMDMAILTLKAYNLLPRPLIALDIFGFCGLWVTRDYAHLCDYLELWEINPAYARYARKILPKANVKIGDSIEAIKEGKILRDDYNFIVIDNPLAGTFGSGKYCEHFDVFPNLIERVASKSIIIMNVVTDMEAIIKKAHHAYKDWIIRRKEFYGIIDDCDVVKLKVDKLLEIYISKFKNWEVNIQNIFFIPRNEACGFLILSLDRQYR